MSRLGLEKEKEPEVKLPTSVGSKTKLGNARKTTISVSSIAPKPKKKNCTKAFLTVWIITNFGELLKRWEYQIILPVS